MRTLLTILCVTSLCASAGWARDATTAPALGDTPDGAERSPGANPTRAEDRFQTSAAGALRSLTGVDVVLANIFMPQKDGLEVIRTIHPAAPDLRIIALSGGPSWQGGSQQEAIGGPAGMDVQALALEFGAWRVLPAPFDWAALQRAIEEALRGSQQRFEEQDR